MRALRGEALAVNGDGSQTRSFCYVDDLIDGLVKLMQTDGGFTGPVNLGNPEEFAILDLAERTIRLRSKSRIEFMPLP